MGLWETYGKHFIAENTQAAHVRACGRVNGAAPEPKPAGAADPQRAERVRIEDAAYSKWLDGCQGYYDGCFSCHAFLPDRLYFCVNANRDVFGADVIEIEKLRDDGAAAGVNAGERTRHGGFLIGRDLSKVRPMR